MESGRKPGNWVTGLSIDTNKWSLALLNSLEWKKLEEVCAAFFQCTGFKAEIASFGADGGADIHLFHEGSDKPSVIVQCKAGETYIAGAKPIRELLAVMELQGVTEGAFVTTGSYTTEARNMVAPPGMALDLMDGNDFLRKILSLTPQHQSWLLKLATAGDFTTPTCARCGVKMVLTENENDGEKFWRCRNYPGCISILSA